jgi:uncharacterized protein with von Willebrand factor type A (vWA) domain
MYPFRNLPGNLIAFGRFLRREHGFVIGPGELHDAARALEIVDLSDEQTVRSALRPILSRRLDEVNIFDKAFTAFFFPGDARMRRLDRQFVRTRPESEAADASERTEPSLDAAADVSEVEGPEVAGGSLVALATIDTEATPALLARSSYSPLSAEASDDAPELPRVDAAWRDAARSLIRRFHFGLSRRLRPAARGQRFDLRRTLRTSLQTGGEALTPRWLQRPRRQPRFVLLIDGSRSMSAYARTALQIAVAMASVTLRVEIFTFSTALQRVTPDVRRCAAGGACRLESLNYAWGGGTSIGACLREFLDRFGDHILGRESVMIIASDGLDVGEPETLRDAMSELQRRSAAVVWLNPLLETTGYEPTASGMSTARPFITTFASVSDAAALATLSRLVRVRG